METNMNNKEVELELIISGDVQGVGYRQYVKRVARKLNIKGSAKNLEDETVEIRCKGEIDNINLFKDKINVKNPLDAPLIEVDGIISEKPLPQGTIKEKTFTVVAGDIRDELLESHITGINYLNLFRRDTGNNLKEMNSDLGNKIDSGFSKMDDNLKEMNSDLGNKIDSGFSKMDDNFGKMDEKYKLISEGMFAIVDRLEKRDKSFEKRIEKTEKNIEELLKILVQQMK